MSVKPRTVLELANDGAFNIPSFQRGYRWDELQVQQLLEDIYDYIGERESCNKSLNSGWYCLQPIFVTRKTANKNTVSVIDGQQRLTTLFLFCRALGMKNAWRISYETRVGSGDFLNSFDDAMSDEVKVSLRAKARDNPDYHFIFGAWQCISDWLRVRSDADKEMLKDALAKYVKVLWYETDGDPYDEFIRLNSGKISLTNAELIKALILEDRNDERVIVGKWDRIEQKLADDELWYFINPDPENSRFIGTRIDFVFELVLRVDAKIRRRQYANWKCGSFDLEQTAIKNPYYMYTIFERFCRGGKGRKINQDQIWKDTEDYFSRIINWYLDRELYHLIGYSMNRKGKNAEEKFAQLVDFLAYSMDHTKSDFREYVRNYAWKSLERIHRDSRNDVGIDIEKLCALSYVNSGDTAMLNDVLLLFNIGLLMYQRSEQSRYPFKTCRSTKWSLEHIHAKNERMLRLSDIRRIVYDTCGLICGKGSEELEWSDQEWCAMLGGDSWVEKCNEALSLHGVTIVCQNHDDATPVFCRVKLVEEADEYGHKEWRIEALQEETHSISNLALLDCRANAEFNNGVYWEKLDILRRWEVGEHKSIRAEYNEQKDFIPLGTRLTFFKHFSGNVSKKNSDSRSAVDTGCLSSVGFMWEPSDGESYVDAIVKVLTDCYANFGKKQNR